MRFWTNYNSKSIVHIGVIVLFMMIAPFQASGQSKELERLKKERIKNDKLRTQKEKEIKELNGYLKKTRSLKKASGNNILILKKKINIREEIVNNLNGELSLIDKQIREEQKRKAAKEVELKELKEEYAKMLVYSYKNRKSESKIMFVFSSSTFNQAYKRSRYLQEYTKHRKHQAELIVKAEEEIDKVVERLNDIRKEKRSFLQEKNEEKIALTKEKQEKEELFANLKSKESDLRKKLKKSQREKQQIASAIQRLIEQKIAEQKRLDELAAAAAAADKAKKNEKEYARLAEAEKLSREFASNRNKLPWPTQQGSIIKKFGKQRHEVNNLEYFNNGIDIITNDGSPARAIFAGTVKQIMVLPPQNYVVLISHGDYYTVYSGLSSVYVKAGDKVETKQKLGMVGTDSDDGSTVLQFQVWNQQGPQDPVSWLYAQK